MTTTKEQQIEQNLIDKLVDLKYIYREDIRDRDALERNFREKFEALNKVKLSDSEFSRLCDQIVIPDVFTAAKILRERNSFEREDGTPLHYTLVNIKDWCKNTFEVVNQLCINTKNRYHRYDVILLINGVYLLYRLNLKHWMSVLAVPFSRLLTIKMIPATAIPIRCFVLCNFLLSAIKLTPGILPITIASTLGLMLTNASCLFINSREKTTKKLPIWRTSPSNFSPNVHWAK